ncbi:hypothetical protein ACFSFY_00230 [Sporosarcina siberiensis]|uniref:Tubby C-terminal domain-containing protein n=1 Tax=Sporosarcina siberiensis TaxID=1365606 RepID=A0ABW4SAW1_9BACL
MNTYSYQGPYVKSSTVRATIKDVNGKEHGSIERYFKSIFHRIFDMWIGENKLISTFRAFNEKGIQLIAAKKNHYKLKKSDFDIQFLNDDSKEKFIARQKGMDILTPEYVITGNNLEIISKKGILDWVKFYEGGKEIARWKFSIKEKFKVNVEIEDIATIKDPLFYSVLGQILYFVGD